MGEDRAQLRDQILEEALSLPAADRRVFVQRVCMADAELEAEVSHLIDVHEDMNGNFLECPPASEPIEFLQAGLRLQNYQIESTIGRGSMSIVYRARDIRADRLVALKLVNTLTLDWEEARRRFLLELKALLKVQHENIVRVHDSGEYEGQPFIVMELLSGKDLDRAIRAGECGGMSVRVESARQIAAALAHVHMAGILHRDVKPSNVFVEDSGRIKLMDFGVSRLLEPGLSHASTFAGTVQYMAPELLSGAPATRATDIYSYGVLLYELFSDQRPAGFTSMAALLESGAESALPLEALERSGVPPAILEIVKAATSRDPAARLGSFLELQAQLAAAKQDV